MEHPVRDSVTGCRKRGRAGYWGVVEEDWRGGGGGGGTDDQTKYISNEGQKI